MNADYECPLSKAIMTDPVILIETGQTYDRESILQWFDVCRDQQRTCTDPCTGKALTSRALVENWALRSLISTAGHPLTNKNHNTVQKQLQQPKNKEIISEKVFKTE